MKGPDLDKIERLLVKFDRAVQWQLGAQYRWLTNGGNFKGRQARNAMQKHARVAANAYWEIIEELSK